MAVWQVKIRFLPQNAPVVQRWNDWPNFAAFSEDLTELIGAPRQHLWSRQTLQWGDERFTDARLYLDDNELGWAVRIDLRDLESAFVERLSNVLTKFRFYISEGDELQTPTVANLKAIIQHSNAQRFVDDPKTYFHALTANRKQHES